MLHEDLQHAVERTLNTKASSPTVEAAMNRVSTALTELVVTQSEPTDTIDPEAGAGWDAMSAARKAGAEIPKGVNRKSVNQGAAKKAGDPGPKRAKRSGSGGPATQNGTPSRKGMSRTTSAQGNAKGATRGNKTSGNKPAAGRGGLQSKPGLSSNMGEASDQRANLLSIAQSYGGRVADDNYNGGGLVVLFPDDRGKSLFMGAMSGNRNVKDPSSTGRAVIIEASGSSGDMPAGLSGRQWTAQKIAAKIRPLSFKALMALKTTAGEYVPDKGARGYVGQADYWWSYLPTFAKVEIATTYYGMPA